MCKTPHKHAELIKAWADGAQIQSCWVEYPDDPDGPWADDPNPFWYTGATYRIKPEPKPDIVRYARATGYEYKHFNEPDNITSWTRVRTKTDNVKATFDGETGKLKKVEIISE